MKVEITKIINGRWENEDYFITGNHTIGHNSITFTLILKEDGNRFIFQAFFNDRESYNITEEYSVLNVLKEGYGYDQIRVPKLVYEAIGNIIDAIKDEADKHGL
jgi:hypothetical protein